MILILLYITHTHQPFWGKGWLDNSQKDLLVPEEGRRCGSGLQRRCVGAEGRRSVGDFPSVTSSVPGLALVPLPALLLCCSLSAHLCLLSTLNCTDLLWSPAHAPGFPSQPSKNNSLKYLHLLEHYSRQWTRNLIVQWCPWRGMTP